VLGTDLSESAAATARACGVEVRVGALADLGLGGASFDVAVLCHSLEHVPDPNVELRELNRILVPGGHLHLAVPNGHAVRLALDGAAWAHLSHPLHFWFFDPNTLTQLLARHGFRLVSPPRTTTRHHALAGCWRDGRAHGWPGAIRRLLAFLRASRHCCDGGDVLRVVAQKAPL
jgi:SAM-dependent methyltransferase